MTKAEIWNVMVRLSNIVGIRLGLLHITIFVFVMCYAVGSIFGLLAVIKLSHSDSVLTHK